MYTLLAIFIGGGLGSICRYGISAWVMRLSDGQFPWGTLSANVLACIVMGIIWMLLGKDIQRNSGWVAFGIVGFCGGFSTFSTFSFETLRLLREGMFLWAGLNVLISVLACLAVLYIIVKSS